MAPRRPDRITRSGAPRNTPVSISVTPRSNRNGRNTRIPPRKVIIARHESVSKKLVPDPRDLDDICSDLSSLPSTPRHEIRQPASRLRTPSQSANTSFKVQSAIGLLERTTHPEIPTRALQATGDDTAHPRVLLGTLVRDQAIPAINSSGFSLSLDRHHAICSPPGTPPPPFPSDHHGSDAGGVFLVTPAGLSPAAHQPAEKCMVMRPALAQKPFCAELAIASSSSFSSTHDSATPLSPHYAGETSEADQSNSIVSNSSPTLNRHSSQYLPSSSQRSTFLTDSRSRTPDYSPPVSPLHQSAPSETTIDLCFTLARRRETPVLQHSPVSSGSPIYPEDPDHPPSPLSAVIPSPAIPSVNISESPHHKSPEHESINLATDDKLASTSPLGSSPPALKLGLDICGFPRPLRAVIHSRNTSLHAILDRRAAQPPFSFASAVRLTSPPPLDNAINQDSEEEQEERRCTSTPARSHEQEEQQEREDTPLSYVVSETTQEETRSTSGDSFVLSTTSPFLQSSSKVSFVSSSIAYQVALGQESILPPISASSAAETSGTTGIVDVGVEELPTPSVPKPSSVTLKTPRGLLERKVSFYATVRKGRILQKDELADSQAQSNMPIRLCAPLPALTDNEEIVEKPMHRTPNPKRSKGVRVVADSDPEEDRSTSESTLIEQRRWRRRRRRPLLVQSSSPNLDPESEEREVATTLGTTAAAPIVLYSDPETEADVRPVRSSSVINISSGDEAQGEEAEAEHPIPTFKGRQQDCMVPAPRGRFSCVEVPTLRQLQRARAKAAGKLARNWTGKVNLGQTSWTLGIARRTCFSPKRPGLLSPSSPSEDELNWDEQDEREEDGGLVIALDCTQWPQRTHTKRFGDAKTPKGTPPSSRPSFPPHISPKKRKRMGTDGESTTDELDEWVPEPVRPALGLTKRIVTIDMETDSTTGHTMSHPAPSIKRPRMTSRGGPTVVQFQCTIPGASFSRPPVEPFRTSVAQANASINLSTIRAPRFISRGSGCSFGCHNCRSSTDRNVKIRCSNFDRDTGGQCMHHWCERCLAMWYGFDGRGLLSAYALSGEMLGPKETRALGEPGTDGGVGLGLGVIPGKWICPNCLGKCMCTYCTKKDGRSRSRFKSDTVGIPLNLEGLDALEGAPGLRGIRPKEKKKPLVAPAMFPVQSTTPSLVSLAEISTQNGESSTSTSTLAPPVTRRPRITRELQDLLIPEFGHGMHVNDHGELQVYKHDAAGNVVCVGVPTRMRTRACPDGAPESMGGIGVSATELYRPIFLPGERERWRTEVGLGEESPGSDSEVDTDRSVSVDVEHDPVVGSEGLPRRANFVNVPWGARLPQAQKRLNTVVQTRPENKGEGDIPPRAAQGAERGGNLGHYVEPVLDRAQFDISSLLTFGAEAETGAAGDIDLQPERHFTSTEALDTVLYTMEPLCQIPSADSVAPALPNPALDLAPAQEWGGWETMALEFGDPSFNPLPSCDSPTIDGVSTVPAADLDASSQKIAQ